jgi:hypothetical protein
VGGAPRPSGADDSHHRTFTPMNEHSRRAAARSLDPAVSNARADGDSAVTEMAGTELPLRLYTPEQVGQMLQVPASWLRKKVSARSVPCTFVGKHLRFSAADIAAIISIGSTPATERRAGSRRRIAP